jgi:hypothetical protein
MALSPALLFLFLALAVMLGRGGAAADHWAAAEYGALLLLFGEAGVSGWGRGGWSTCTGSAYTACFVRCLSAGGLSTTYSQVEMHPQLQLAEGSERVVDSTRCTTHSTTSSLCPPAHSAQADATVAQAQKQQQQLEGKTLQVPWG